MVLRFKTGMEVNPHVSYRAKGSQMDDITTRLPFPQKVTDEKEKPVGPLGHNCPNHPRQSSGLTVLNG